MNVYQPGMGNSVVLENLGSMDVPRLLALNTTTWKLEPTEVTEVQSTGRALSCQVTTQLGRTVYLPANYQLLSFMGWKGVEELTVGTHIAIPRVLPGPCVATMTHAELALLGHLIGNGCTLPRHCIQYTTGDEDIAALVMDIAVEAFGDKVKPRMQREEKQDGTGCYQTYLPASYRLTHGVHNPIASWLDQMGAYGLRSYEKHVPACVFSQPTESIAVFLKHLWSTDGHVSCRTHNKEQKPIPRIYYATSSEQLGLDVQSLLLRLGINARIKLVSQNGKGRDQFHIIVSGKPDLERFIGAIGIVGERRQSMLDEVKTYIDGRVANTNRDVIPSLAWRRLVVPAMKAIGMTTRQLCKGLDMSYCGTNVYKNNISRERTMRVAKVVQSDYLAILAQSDVYWDEIASIDLGDEISSYRVSSTFDNFVANNIIVRSKPAMITPKNLLNVQMSLWNENDLAS